MQGSIPQCWGADFVDQVGDMPTGLMRHMDAGRDHSCGITRELGSLVCWGSDIHGQSSPPE
jgi:hypothetical protein